MHLSQKRLENFWDHRYCHWSKHNLFKKFVKFQKICKNFPKNFKKHKFEICIFVQMSILAAFLCKFKFWLHTGTLANFHSGCMFVQNSIIRAAYLCKIYFLLHITLKWYIAMENLSSGDMHAAFWRNNAISSYKYVVGYLGIYFG